jgi:hypothetical protein
MVECVVCDDKIKNALALRCGHIFCIDCVIHMVQSRNRKCPLCRFRITYTISNLERERLRIVDAGFVADDACHCDVCLKNR